MLLRSIEFHVKVDPPKTMKFFELFTFQLKGFGFNPSAKKFGGDPAISISGQVMFMDVGDLVSPNFKFHMCWIAGPEEGRSLPRIRFDGLTTSIKKGAVKIEATAIAVDDSLPDLYAPDVLPANFKVDGFLASGALSLSGWAPMHAQMGFLEISDRNTQARPKHAFFVYGGITHQSERIDTPIGTIYLREYGFGFGYRYTLAGIARAETAQSPQELVKILDDVSRRHCLLYTSPSPRDQRGSRMPSSA